MAVIVAWAMALVTASAGVGAPPEPARAGEHPVFEYWTPERIARAIPREVVVDTPRVPLAKPPGLPGGGGGGGGDDSSGAVTGAAWTKGGAVKQTTGKVLFTLGTSNYVCSGSAVVDQLSGHSMVLTAGHCVYDEQNKRFATNWVFFPNFEDNPDLGCSNTDLCFAAAGLVTTVQWSNRDFEHDYAFAIIAPNDAGSLEGLYGTQAIAFNQGRGLDVYAFGYPHARPYNGTKLIYCAGTATNDPYGSTTQGLRCDMTGGSSGGPWFAGFDESTGTGTLYSVNSYKYRNDKNTMYGPYLGSGASKTYTFANSWTSGNHLVDAS